MPHLMTAILKGLLVLVDRPDSAEARADERMLRAAGAHVLPADASDGRPVDGYASQFASVVLIVDAAVVSGLSGRLPAVLRGLDNAFCIVVGPGPDSATRTGILRWGADDCLDWPYLPDELVARIEALLRRQPRSRHEVLSSAGLQMELHQRTVRLFGSLVVVTPREYDLLAYLLRHPDVVHTRQDLLANVWGYLFGGTETVTVHVRRLRAKIERDPGRPQRILTVRGRGYLFASGVSPLPISGTENQLEGALARLPGDSRRGVRRGPLSATGCSSFERHGHL